MKYGRQNTAKQVTVKTTDYSATALDSGTVYSNEGATAIVNFTLPTAQSGLTYTFMVQDSDGIKVTANSGDTIRLGSYVTDAAGFVQLNSLGAILIIEAVNATEWIGSYYSGTISAAGYGNAYFAGGNGGTYSNQISKLVSDSSCASITATITNGNRTGCAAGTISSSAYWAGGQSASNTIGKLVSDSSFTSVAATLSISRQYIYGTVANFSTAALYIAGGGSGGANSNVIDKLSSDSTCAAVTSTRTYTNIRNCAATIGSSAYFMGGDTNINTINKLSSDTTCAAVAATLSTGRHGSASGTISSSAYIVAGFNAAALTVIDKLTNDSTCAAVSATLGLSRYNFAGSAIMNSAFYTAGGDGGPTNNRIDKLTNDTTCASVAATLFSVITTGAGLTVNF